MYLYAHMQGLRIRTGRPIHEMGTSHFFDGKGLVKPCGIELRSLEQSRAQANCALFASCDREVFETVHYIRDG